MRHSSASDRPLDAFERRFRSSTEREAYFRQTITVDKDWRPREHLTVTYRMRKTSAGTVRIAAVRGDHASAAGFDGADPIPLDAPVPLHPVHIPKPWGEEVWFTGIERRGESTVGERGSWPLSAFLGLAPDRLCRRMPLTLLKILVPHARSVYGDLYFEVHATKQEVYVVTGVDPAAWPGGVGRIRYGMNQTLRRRMNDDRAFRRAYLEAVSAYEAVRRRLDADGSSCASDIDTEVRLRAEMEAFTELRELRRGDVVHVPTWLPHSLQHGVRVVEFQTPTYERYILSFAQAVVTQDRWDTGEVIDRIRLDVPSPPVEEHVAPGVSRIVAFDDFGAWRIRLDSEPGAPPVAIPSGVPYLVAMGIEGTTRIGELGLGPEQAALVPACAVASTSICPLGGSATVLLAAPGL